MSVTRVISSDRVVELATGLLDVTRDRPWGVVTIPAGAQTPLVDIEQLHDEAGDVCQFFVIQTGTLTRELDALLPDRCQVYGGASRIYPVGIEWVHTPERSPLRFVHEASYASSTTDKLVTDALGMADAAGLFAKPAPTAVHARGEVRSLLAAGSRALVQLENGGYATVVSELTFPGIPLEWAIQEGQTVDGQYDPQTKRLALDMVRVDPKQLLEHYPNGTVTLAFVVSVERQRGVLAVHPSLPITVTRDDVSSNRLDRVDLLLAPGDVVRVRVVRDEQGHTRLRSSDIDDDEPTQPALALVPGGEPWLQEDRHRPEPARPEPDAQRPAPPDDHPASVDETTLSDETPEPRASVPPPAPRPGPGAHHITAQPMRDSNEAESVAPVAPTARRHSSALISTQLALEQERERTRQLEAQLKSSGGENAYEQLAVMRLELGEVLADNRRLQEQLRRMRVDQQAQRAMLRTARQAVTVPGYATRRDHFDRGEDWVKHEIYLAWVERMGATDRAAWPLPNTYTVGDGFAPSLEQLDNPSRNKAFKAAVDVLTGRVRDLPARSPHPLRRGEGASTSDVVRADGARCMRVHIEKSVASARRLHYWVSDSGEIELSRVVLHDDMEP